MKPGKVTYNMEKHIRMHNVNVGSILMFVSILVLACIKSVAAGADTQSDTSPAYFQAKHGYGGGLTEMIDLSTRDGFDALRSIDDVAKFASKVPGAIGFTAHPGFAKGARYAHAVLWYTKRSPKNSSWGLYLFDRSEADKAPGDAPRAEAVAAAEAKVASRMQKAKELIEAGGSNGVELPGDYAEQKVLGLAVMRQGGFFKHTGAFGADGCAGCRTVVPGGTPFRCGIGVQGKEHWNCCGSTEKEGHCRYWELVKAQDDAK